MQYYFIFFINFSQKWSLTRKSINECAALVHQIKMRNGIPFALVISNMPKAYEDYTDDEIALMCDKAIEEHNNGTTISSEDVELNLRKKFNNAI